MIKKLETGAATTKKSGKTSTRKIREMPLKKVSRVLYYYHRDSSRVIFNLPSEKLSRIILTDSDSILMEKT